MISLHSKVRPVQAHIILRRKKVMLTIPMTVAGVPIFSVRTYCRIFLNILSSSVPAEAAASVL